MSQARAFRLYMTRTYQTCTRALCGRVGTIHPLSTLLKPAFQGDNACWVLLAHLTHTTHDPLHASMAAALICMCSLSRTHHTLMITSSSACVTLAWPSLSWICQLFRRAQPRLTSAIIECVLSASFWQGLCFAVQKCADGPSSSEGYSTCML